MTPPFTIETIAGDQVDIDDSFLDYLLKSTMNGTGVPSSYIDAQQDVDFARTLAMQNQTFVRKIIKYQNDFGLFWTDVLRTIIDIEQGTTLEDENVDNKNDSEEEDNVSDEKIISEQVEIEFPTPIYMNLNNMNEQSNASLEAVDRLVELFFGSDSQDEDGKKEFRLQLAKNNYMKTIDWESIESVYKKSLEDKTRESFENGADDEDEGGF